MDAAGMARHLQPQAVRASEPLVERTLVESVLAERGQLMVHDTERAVVDVQPVHKAVSARGYQQRRFSGQPAGAGGLQQAEQVGVQGGQSLPDRKPEEPWQQRVVIEQQNSKRRTVGASMAVSDRGDLPQAVRLGLEEGGIFILNRTSAGTPTVAAKDHAVYRCHVGLVEEGLLSSCPPHGGILRIGVAVAPDVVFTGRTEPAYGPRLVRKIRSAQPQKP